MENWKKLFVSWLIVALLLPFAIAQEKVALEYKFKEGQTLYMLVVTQGQVSIQLPESVQQGAMPPAFPLSMALISSMKTIKTYSDGAADLEVRFLEGKMYMMGEEISFPQQQKETPQAIRLRMGKKGNIIRLLTPISTQSSPMGPIPIDPNMLIQSLSRFSLLPEQEVGVGEQWELKMDMDLPPLGKLNILYKMNLTSFEKVGDKNYAKIAMEVPPSTLQLNIPLTMLGNTPAVEGQEVSTIPMSGQVEMKGDMLFDYQNGYTVSQNGTLKMLLNLTMPAAGGQGTAPQITVDINMKFRLNWGEKRPQLPTATQIQQQIQSSNGGQV